MTYSLDRRHALQAFLALGVAGCTNTQAPNPAPVSIAALYAGQVNDRGFMQSGYEGLMQARATLGVSTRYMDGI